jgi:hypothetical protein
MTRTSIGPIRISASSNYSMQSATNHPDCWSKFTFGPEDVVCARSSAH